LPGCGQTVWADTLPVAAPSAAAEAACSSARRAGLIDLAVSAEVFVAARWVRAADDGLMRVEVMTQSLVVSFNKVQSQRSAANRASMRQVPTARNTRAQPLA
jgi:hypothetical protein